MFTDFRAFEFLYSLIYSYYLVLAAPALTGPIYSQLRALGSDSLTFRRNHAFYFPICAIDEVADVSLSSPVIYHSV